MTSVLGCFKELMQLFVESKLPYGLVEGFALQAGCEVKSHAFIDGDGRETWYVMPVLKDKKEHPVNVIAVTGPPLTPGSLHIATFIGLVAVSFL